MEVSKAGSSWDMHLPIARETASRNRRRDRVQKQKQKQQRKRQTNLLVGGGQRIFGVESHCSGIVQVL